MSLAPCLSCRRHARVGEACPFCGGIVAAKRGPVARMPLRVAAIASLAIGCSSETVTPVYGAPAPDTGADMGTTDTGSAGDSGGAMDTAVTDTEPMDGSPGNLYGAPPPDDGG